MFDEIKVGMLVGKSAMPMMNGDYETAIEFLENAKSLTERDEIKTVCLARIGECYLKMKRFEESMEVLNIAMNKMNEDPSYWGQGIPLETFQETDINIQVCEKNITDNKQNQERAR